jgi:cysteine synthase B
MARELVANDTRYVMPYQYGNLANPLVHERTTAEEILADCPEVDVFVAGLGTGGTLMGVGRRLKRHRSDIKVYAAEPLPGDAVQGLRSLDDGFIPEILDPSLLDGRLLVSAAESLTALRELTALEGIFAGVSSGGVVAAAQRVAATMDRGTIVVVLADGGWKYLSEEVWTRDLEADAESVERLSLW